MTNPLIDAFDDLVLEEQGRMPVAANVMKHLPSLSAEEARGIYEHIVAQRVSTQDRTTEQIRHDVELLAEGLLCGLRLASIATQG